MEADEGSVVGAVGYSSAGERLEAFDRATAGFIADRAARWDALFDTVDVYGSHERSNAYLLQHGSDAQCVAAAGQAIAAVHNGGSVIVVYGPDVS